jgi:hypothetical protein
MGLVKTATGTQIMMDEVEGLVTLQELYQDVKCEHYTDLYRSRCMQACAKLGRQAWGVLPILRDLAKSSNVKIQTASKEALRKIDPGMPDLDGEPLIVGSHQPHASDRPAKNNAGTFPVQTNTGIVYRKPSIKKVTIVDVPVDGDLSEGTRVMGTCNFCEKNTIFTKNLRRYCEQIVGPDLEGQNRLFCNFCLRNAFYKTKLTRNILILSFRSIIGYYFYCFHNCAKQPSMWLDEIKGFTELHIKLGTQNPLFRYDPETFCWFVDFNKVGTTKRRMPVEYVLETILDIMSAFGLYEHIRESSPVSLFEKYKDAVLDFHHHRRRPVGQKILAPTLFGCGIPVDNTATRGIPITSLKNFLPTHLIENFKQKARQCT